MNRASLVVLVYRYLDARDRCARRKRCAAKGRPRPSRHVHTDERLSFLSRSNETFVGPSTRSIRASQPARLCRDHCKFTGKEDAARIREAESVPKESGGSDLLYWLGEQHPGSFLRLSCREDKQARRWRTRLTYSFAASLHLGARRKRGYGFRRRGRERGVGKAKRAVRRKAEAEAAGRDQR